MGGGGSDPGELLLAEARIFVDWSDAANNSGRFAKNQNDPRTPTGNILSMVSGAIGNESGGVSPAKTFYAGIDPSGVTSYATRITTNSTNQTLYLHRSAGTPALPNGTYTLRFRMRASSGTGPHSINYGQSAAYATGSAVDLDWSNPTNDAATTFTRELTWAGSGDIAIRFPNTAGDVLIDRVQLYPGTAASVPAWADEVVAGGRRPFIVPNAIPLSADDNADLTGLPSGLIVVDPDYPAKKNYTAYTIMTVNSIDAIPGASSHIVNYHADDGGSTTGNLIGVENTSPYAGEVYGAAGASSRAYMAANMAGDGIFIFGQGRDATIRKNFVDAVPAYTNAPAFAGINVARWNVGSWSTTSVAEYKSNLALGDYAFTVIWDRLLTNQEWMDAANAIRARLTARSVAMMPFTDFHVISGDSNSTRATGDWTQLLPADGYLAPQRNLIASITSVGGQGIDSIERETPGAEAGLADGTITANGRFGVYDQPALLGGVQGGRYALYHLPIGTNDWDLLDAYSGDNAAKAAAYCARVQSFIAHALATHERVHVMWYSLLPQTSTSRPNWEAQRLLVNAEMATWIAGQSRVHLCDFGGSATIGDRSLQAGGGGTYYLSDEIHLTPAGDIEAAAIAKTAVQAWRTGLGIA